MLTFEKALSKHQIDVPPHLLAQAEVPVLSGVPQAQGDLIFLPTRRNAKTGDPVPADGVQLVRGEATSNTHWLDAYQGVVLWAPVEGGGADLGQMTVPDGSVALVTHTDEHGANAFGPGSYIVRRQVEQADQIRVVAD